MWRLGFVTFLITLHCTKLCVSRRENIENKFFKPTDLRRQHKLTTARTRDHLQHRKTQGLEKGDFQQPQPAGEDCRSHYMKENGKNKEQRWGVHYAASELVKGHIFRLFFANTSVRNEHYLRKTKAQVITWLQEPGL